MGIAFTHVCSIAGGQCLDRISGICYNGNEESVYRYSYDANGNITSITDNISGQITTFRYDSRGRLCEYYVNADDNEQNQSSQYIRYDEEGRPQFREYTRYFNYGSMVSANYVDHYVYDGEGRLSGYNFTAGGGAAYSWNTSYTYDDFDRLGSRSIDWDENGSGILWDTTYTYAVAGSVVYDQIKNVTNTVVRKDTSATIDSETFTYIYDDNGNITIIRRDGLEMLRYGYDDLGQLVREDNRYTGKSYTWKYDEAGNILNRKTYAYTIDALGTVQNTVTYGYDTGNWGDLLISFNGQSIAYDGIGNPGTWNGSALTWQGRRLMSYGSNTYTYNADGIRTSKTVNGVEHIYHLSGTQILDEEWTEGNIRHLMVYVYDASGQPIGISHYTYNGTIVSENDYLLVSNIRGDIIGIYDSNGTRVVTYVYDAWGRILSTTGTGANTIGVYNPFRYRGYYYDTETGFYYVSSRYYDPEIGRFINADGYVSTGQGVLGYNMFAYCGNDPVNRKDPTGQFWSEIWEFAKTAVSEIGKAIGVLSPAYAGCGGAALADGLLPIGDLIGLAGAALLTVGAVGYGIYQATQAPSISIPKADTKEKDSTAPPPSPTVIYRYGGSNPGNLTPKAKDLRDGRGLSFSTIPAPGCSMTTIEALNATGIVYAVQDGATHVSVYPVGGTMSDWVSAGSSSIWTQAVKSVIIKWDGVS